MKWAPNKKLHFEVAIIRAIQSLGQATLDEVIENLGELRDGKVFRKKHLYLWRQACRLHLKTPQPARLPLQRRGSPNPASKKVRLARIYRRKPGERADQLGRRFCAKIPREGIFANR